MSTTQCYRGKLRCAGKYPTAVLFLFLGVSAAAAQPEVPNGLGQFLEYQFEPEQIISGLYGSYVISTLRPDGRPHGNFEFGMKAIIDDGNGALLFDELMNFVLAEESWNLSFRNGVVVEARIKVTDPGVNLPGGIVAKWWGNQDQWSLVLNQGSGGEPYGKLDFNVRLDDGTLEGDRYIADYRFMDPSEYIGKWITVTGLYDPAKGVVELYIDDDQKKSVATATIGMPIMSGNLPIRIGDSGDFFDAVTFKGEIDDVKIWCDYDPDQFDAVPLIRYDFDSLDEGDSGVTNLFVEPIDWMNGRINGAPDPVEGPSGGDDQALQLNVPLDETALEFIEVIHGEYLTFNQGLLIKTKIFLEKPLSKGTHEIVDYVRDAGGSHWRLSFEDRTDLTLRLYFEDGRTPVVSYEFPTNPPLDKRWIDVAALYDPTAGTAALFWDGHWVETKYVGHGVLSSGPGAIWIGTGWAPWAAFEGAIDEVEIWGDPPPCYELTTKAKPQFPDVIWFEPRESQIPKFCTGHATFAVGEKVHLEAESNVIFLGEIPGAFYEWSNNLEYLEGSEKHMNTVSVAILEDTTATATYFTGDYPKMTVFPVYGEHNTGSDSPFSYELGCGPEAKALSNNDCIGAGHEGVDVFGNLGDPIVAAQSGYVVFDCVYNSRTQQLTGGNSAYIYVLDCNPDLDPDCCIPGRDPGCRTRDVVKYAHFYAHLDGVCSTNGENPCNEQWYEDNCPDCRQYDPYTGELLGPEQETECLVNFDDGDFVEAGDKLGELGNTGNAEWTSHHLHYGIYEPKKNWRASCKKLNPFPFLYVLEENSCTVPEDSSLLPPE